MAGSRVEKIGNVFTRVTGLLNSGALKESEKPVWYDVYKAFPPRTPQNYVRPVDPRPPIDIVYHEDLIRAAFRAKYTQLPATDLTNVRKSLVARFVDYYKEIKESGITDEEEIFKEIAKRFESEGVRLVTREEAQQARQMRENLTREMWQSESYSKPESQGLTSTHTPESESRPQDDREESETLDTTRPEVFDPSRVPTLDKEESEELNKTLESLFGDLNTDEDKENEK